jgi:hypothetical protein
LGPKKSFGPGNPCSRWRRLIRQTEGFTSGDGPKKFAGKNHSANLAGKFAKKTGAPAGSSSTFDKFKGNKKPWGKRGAPARKSKEDRQQ